MIDKILEQQETIKGLQNNEESLIKIMKEYEDYKLRVDKAIEHLEESIDIIKGDSMIPIYSGNVRRRYLKPVLEILKGDSK